MAGMKIGQSFSRTSAAPVDETLVLTKAEMLNMDDDFMPDNYFAVCKDDGKFYTYDKSATPNAATGKFRLVLSLPEGGSVGEIITKDGGEDGEAFWGVNTGAELVKYNRKYGQIPARFSIKQLVASDLGSVNNDDRIRYFSVPDGGVLTSDMSFLEGVYDTFDVYITIDGYEEKQVVSRVSSTFPWEYTIENTSLKWLINNIVTENSKIKISTYANTPGLTRRITQIRLVARGGNDFGYSEGTQPYEIRNLTGMVLDDLKVTGNSVLTDWGVVQAGTATVNNVRTDISGEYVWDLSGYGFTSTNDYSIHVEIVGGTGGFADSIWSMVKRTNNASIYVKGKNSNVTQVVFSYTLVAKGYGNNTMNGGGTGSVDVDASMSDSSTNPVQNNVIKAYVDAKQDALTAGTGVKIENDEISFNYVTAGRKAVAYVGTHKNNDSYSPLIGAYDKTEYIELSEMSFTDTSDYAIELSGTFVGYISENETSKSFSFSRTVNGQSIAMTTTFTKETSRIVIRTTGERNNQTNNVYCSIGIDVVYKVYYTGQATSGASGTVDQTYDEISTNAQSGTAVAEAISLVDNVFVFEVDSEQFTEDVDGNPGGAHVGTYITSPTFDEIKDALDDGKMVFVKMLYNGGKAYEIIQLYLQNNSAITGKYFDLEFPQKNVWYYSAYVNKRITGSTTYFGIHALNLGNIGSGSGITVDTSMSGTSTNPVQNNAIKQYVDNAVTKPTSKVYDNASTAAEFEPFVEGYLVEGGTTYTLYKFFYKTNALPNNNSKVFNISTLLEDYTIQNFSRFTGVTSNGFLLNNGRVDNNAQIALVQQVSKNNKNFTIRTYADWSGQTATLEIEFYGTKNA